MAPAETSEQHGPPQRGGMSRWVWVGAVGLKSGPFPKPAGTGTRLNGSLPADNAMLAYTVSSLVVDAGARVRP
ncbi:MAG: hypothetical protein L3K26_20150 [Candidatus Hydrogenedentes bacterium]|nr:hypothetical protein [Candidatus Hydrogenedentota bacterium]